MLRAVMAVVLATALLATSLPVLDAARRDHTAGTVRAQLDRIETAVADLRTREEAVPPETAGARRVVTVSLPARSWTDAGVSYLAIGGSPRESVPGDRERAEIAWQVRGGPLQERRIPGAVVEPGTRGDEPLVLREPGTHRLALSLVDRCGQRVVVVRRLSD
jgi:hypothetical protein